MAAKDHKDTFIKVGIASVLIIVATLLILRNFGIIFAEPPPPPPVNPIQDLSEQEKKQFEAENKRREELLKHSPPSGS